MSEETFGACLKRLRNAKGLSLSEVGRRSGVPHSNILQIEKGTRGVPTPITMAAIADALDLDAAEMADFRAAVVRYLTRDHMRWLDRVQKGGA